MKNLAELDKASAAGNRLAHQLYLRQTDRIIDLLELLESEHKLSTKV